MFYKIISVCVLLMCFLLDKSATQSCGSCMSNSVKCLNTTEFEMCSGIMTGMKLECPANKVCTDSVNICETLPLANGVIKPCGESGSPCSACSGIGDVVCVGPNELAVCNPFKSNPIACPDATPICFEGLKAMGQICVTEAILTTLEAEATCPTSLVTPTSTIPTNMDEMCRNNVPSGSDELIYFLLPDKDDCTGYIYCEMVYGRYVGSYVQCAMGYYFDDWLKSCRSGTCPTNTVGSTDADPTPSPTDADATPSPTDADLTPSPTDADTTASPTDADPTPSPTDADPTPSPTDTIPTDSQTMDLTDI